MKEACRPVFTGNQLKLLALVSMTLDHVGLILLPGVPVLRLLGRLAFPIYGWMIAEGCRHTHDRRRYLGRLALLAAVCQVANFGVAGSLYQCVLVTFTLSVAVIWAADRAWERGTKGAFGCLAALLAGVFCLCVVLPGAGGTDFEVDYGLAGVLLPVLVYYGGTHRQRLFCLTLGLAVLSLSLGGIQWACLAAVPVLALYNGQRGRGSLGRLFYLYYPLHLAALYAIALAAAYFA